MTSVLTGCFAGGQGGHRSLGAEFSDSYSFIFSKYFIMVTVDKVLSPGTIGARQDHHTHTHTFTFGACF